MSNSFFSIRGFCAFFAAILCFFGFRANLAGAVTIEDAVENNVVFCRECVARREGKFTWEKVTHKEYVSFLDNGTGFFYSENLRRKDKDKEDLQRYFVPFSWKKTEGSNDDVTVDFGNGAVYWLTFRNDSFVVSGTNCMMCKVFFPPLVQKCMYTFENEFHVVEGLDQKKFLSEWGKVNNGVEDGVLMSKDALIKEGFLERLLNIKEAVKGNMVFNRPCDGEQEGLFEYVRFFGNNEGRFYGFDKRNGAAYTLPFFWEYLDDDVSSIKVVFGNSAEFVLNFSNTGFSVEGANSFPPVLKDASSSNGNDFFGDGIVHLHVDLNAWGKESTAVLLP